MEYKLFYFIIGCKLSNRHTEQHDVFFAIGKTAADLIPEIKAFWPEAERLHIDCWRAITNINGYLIKVVPKNTLQYPSNGLSLFFINMGSYKKGEFDEFHFKDIYAAPNQAEAIKLAKKSQFYSQNGFKGAVSHIDNTFGLDIDDIYQIEEILPEEHKKRYSIMVTDELAIQPDEIHLGYTTLSALKQF